MSEDQAFIAKMQNIYAAFTAHDALKTERLERYRNIEPESALFLAMQIRIQQSKKILEIGTSTGYSTMWLAHAATATQGFVETLEIDSSRIAIAKHHAESLGLTQYIEFHQGDALAFLQAQQAVNQYFDFILLDAERAAYVEYWQYLPDLIHKNGGLLIVDNVLSHADQVKALIELIQADERFMLTTLNIGAGLLMIVYA